jgi:transposase
MVSMQLMAEGHSRDEVADVTGRPISTIPSQCRQTKEKSAAIAEKEPGTAK